MAFFAALVAMTILARAGPAAAQQKPARCASYAPNALLKGRKFFNSITGDYIPIKGVNYYPRPNEGALIRTNSIDFYTEEYRYIWERDLEYFKKLGVNVVRIYAVNPALNHDLFFCALREAGMYVIVGLAADCLDCAITKDSAPACYPAALRSRGEFIIQEFARYDNVLAFSAGNEAGLVAGDITINGACQKQFIHDMRAYVARCEGPENPSPMRHIPVGVVVADIERELRATYFSCESESGDALEGAEWIGLNTYVHCNGGETDSAEIVGYNLILEEFSALNLHLPVVITEFGCLNPSFDTISGFEAQRDWLQVETLFSKKFRDEGFSGAVAFEYSVERINSPGSPWPFKTFGQGNYGMGYMSPENCTDDLNRAGDCEYIPKPEFDRLAARFAAVEILEVEDLEKTISDMNSQTEERMRRLELDMLGRMEQMMLAMQQQQQTQLQLQQQGSAGTRTSATGAAKTPSPAAASAAANGPAIPQNIQNAINAVTGGASGTGEGWDPLPYGMRGSSIGSFVAPAAANAAKANGNSIAPPTLPPHPKQKQLSAPVLPGALGIPAGRFNSLRGISNLSRGISGLSRTASIDSNASALLRNPWEDKFFSMLMLGEGDAQAQANAMAAQNALNGLNAAGSSTGGSDSMNPTPMAEHAVALANRAAAANMLIQAAGGRGASNANTNTDNNTAEKTSDEPDTGSVNSNDIP